LIDSHVLDGVPDFATFSSEASAIPDQRQWLRKCSLLVSDNSGTKVIDLSHLHIRFEVTCATIRSLKRLQARIYNLTDETVHSIEKEFTQIELRAGYGPDSSGSLPLLFSGLIAYTRHGKENALDSFLDIVASDCDDAYLYAVVSTSVSARGQSPNDALLQAVTDALQPFGITVGPLPVDGGLDFLDRGAVVHDTVPNLLDLLANAAGCDWFFEDRQVHFVPRGGFRSGGSLVLTPQTGLIGVPTQTLDGLNVRTLLNPLIQTARAINVLPTDIAQTNYRNNVTQPDLGPAPLFPGLSLVGAYKVYQVRHIGDTRGNEWFTESICAALDPVNGISPFNSVTWQQSLIGRK
jgi:hypothetical protein